MHNLVEQHKKMKVKNFFTTKKIKLSAKLILNISLLDHTYKNVLKKINFKVNVINFFFIFFTEFFAMSCKDFCKPFF